MEPFTSEVRSTREETSLSRRSNWKSRPLKLNHTGTMPEPSSLNANSTRPRLPTPFLGELVENLKTI